MHRSIAVLVACALGCTIAPHVDDASFDHDAGPREPDAAIVLADVWPLPDTGPADSDHDGLPDNVERMLGTDPHNADTDGDGWPDGVEVLAGTNPRDPNSHPPATDFYLLLPFGGTRQERQIDFTARLGRADIYFLVDTTASMMPPIDNVRRSLATQIVPAVQAQIADVVMGVGDFRDFPDGVHGRARATNPDYAYTNRQSMTANMSLVEGALNALTIGDGIDLPEASTEALYRTVTGACADGSGGFGTPCFRTMSHPIIVHVTDAPFHDGPDPTNDYSRSPPVPVDAHGWTETLAALTTRNVEIVGAAVSSGPPIPPLEMFDSQSDLTALAMATGSRAASGSTTVYRCEGGQVSTAVVNGIVELVGSLTQDVSARSVDDTSDSVDATRFIRALSPVSATRSIDHMDATTFYGVPGGTTLRFRVEFLNDFQPAQAHAQLFRAYIDVFDAASGVTLDRRNVYILVPSIDGLLT